MYPAKCIICGKILWQDEDGVCAGCVHKVPVIEGNRCIICSKQIEDSEVYCRDCCKRKHIYESGYAVWSYNNISRRIIADIKYAGRLDGINYITDELVYHAGILCKAWNINSVMPVPLHKKKLRHRGFNQAALIAELFAHKLNLRYIDDVLFRVKNTRPQKRFDDLGRIHNLKNAFRIDEERLAKYDANYNVLLVDDIYTSGSTIDECAMALKAVGIKKVYFICLCIGDGY